MTNLHSKLNIKNYTLKNRVIIPAMASATADHHGFVTEQTLGHYARFRDSKISLLIAEYSYVDISGKSEPNQLAIDHIDKLEGLKKLSQTIKMSGALAGMQLVHGGGKTNRKLTGGYLIAPSSVVVPVKNEVLEKSDMATKLDIEMMKASFVRAAQIAYLAGFDLIEIHAAHGYGLNQWLSPITNHRLDEYGGNHSNRNRLLYEIIKLIRKNIPSILISVRIPGQDYFSNGISLSDSVKTAQILELLGVDIISVSSGIGGWRRPRHIRGEGYLVEDAKIIQKFVSLPVIGVGGIKTRDFINQKLSENAFSLAAIGRGFLENPQLDIFTS